MLPASDQLEALRNCCKDEAAFAHLTQILSEILPEKFQPERIPSNQWDNHYKAILDAIPDRMFRLDRQGYYLDFKGNQEDAEMGIRPDQVIGRHVREFLPDPVATLCLDTIEKALGTGNVETCEYQLASPWENASQELRDYEARLVACDVNEVLVIVRDITERKRVEERLRQAEAQYRNIFEATTDGLIINTLEGGRVVGANPICCKMHGYTMEEFIGLEPRTFIHPDSYSLFEEYMAAVTAGKPFRCRAVDLRKDGTPFHVEVQGTRFEYLGKPHLLAVIRDITDQVEAEAALQASEARHRALVDALPDAMFRLQRDGLCVDIKVNQDSELIAPPEQLMGNRVQDLLPPALGQQWLGAVEQALQTGGMQSFEYQILLNGALRDREARFVPAGTDEVVAIMRDITERKQAERAIERERRLFMNGPVTVFRWAVREGWPVEYVSANVAQFGFQPEDFVNGRLYYSDFIHPEDVDRITEEVLDCIAQRKMFYEQEYRIICPDGNERWIFDYNCLVMDESGEITHCEGYALDVTERKRAEAALRESEARFRSLVEQSLAGIYVLQQDKFLYVNPKFCQIFGYACHEFDAMTLNDIVMPVDRELVLENVRKRLHGEAESIHYTFRGRRKDGSQVEIEVLGNKTEFNGQPAVIGTLLDVTERKQAEAALRDSEEKFSTAFRCSPDPIVISRLSDARLLEVNDSFLQVLGYSREEVIGRTVHELGIWVDLHAQETMLQTVNEEGAIRDFEFQFRRKSGEIGVGLFSAERIHLAGEAYMLAVPRDITERRQTEAQLGAAADRDRLLGQIALRIRRSLNLDQILTTTVAEVRQFLGADRVFIGQIDADWQGRVVAESAVPEWGSILAWIADDVYLREIRTLFEQGRVQAIDDTSRTELSPLLSEYYARCQIKASLGVPIILGEQFFGVLIANQCSMPRHWHPFEIDLLEQLATQVAIAIQQAELYQQVQELNTTLERQVEERTAELQQKMQELQELSQLKDDFLHAVSHDLRTPVMGMALVLQNLSKKSEDPVPLPKSVLARMGQSIDRQLNMINSLLEAHSSEVRGVVLHYESVQLGQLVQAIAADLEPLFTENQATLHNRVSLDLPAVTADPAQLRRVFENLITNALRHNPPGLTLTLTATVQEEMVRCSVQDDGVGMTAAESESLFDRYTRGARASRSTGVGLGLYLCRQIIVAHGGQIGVNSAPHQGAIFWFTLPLVGG